MDAWEGIERYGFNAVVDEQDLDDSFNPPFQACLQSGRASGLMCSYNALNGTPTCADPNLLTTMARGTWEFDGYIVSDCDAVESMYAYHNYSDPAGSVAAVLKAGMDINCGDTLANYTGSALEKNLINVDEINLALTRSFAVQFRLGMFDGNPEKRPFGNLGSADVCTNDHQELALEAARQSIVLLKNEGEILPFSQAQVRNLAIIGPNANDTLYTMLGNDAGDPCKYVTPLQGLAKYASTDYVAGCLNTSCDTPDIEGASAAAGRADATVIVVGLGLDQERESFDRTDILLPGQQKELILAVAASAKGPVVLVVMSGGCVDISFARDDGTIGAILWIGYPGQAGGDALAEIVFGYSNPGGKLPSTWYSQELMSWPMTTMDMRPNNSSGCPGRTYRFYTGTPNYNFGDGLSYSRFKHFINKAAFNPHVLKVVAPSSHQMSCGGPSPPENCTAEDLNYCSNLLPPVEVSILNLFGPAGSDVVLLYVSPPDAGRNGLPYKQLVGFQRVAVEARTEAMAKFTVDPCATFVTKLDSNGNRQFLTGRHTLSVNGALSSVNGVEGEVSLNDLDLPFSFIEFSTWEA